MKNQNKSKSKSKIKSQGKKTDIASLKEEWIKKNQSINEWLAIAFLFFLMMTNVLWGSTVGINIYMNDYYELDDASFKGKLINGVFYIFYLLAAPICIFFDYNKSIILSWIISIIGLGIRLEYYIPYSFINLTTNSTLVTNSTDNITIAFTDTDVNADVDANDNDMLKNFKQQFYGVTAIIFANALLAAAQPLLMNYITTVSKKFINVNKRGLYVGMTGVACSLGYAIGYLVSIYSISSASDYVEHFKFINGYYLGLYLIGGIIYFVLIYYKFKMGKGVTEVVFGEEFVEIKVVSSSSDTASASSSKKSRSKLSQQQMQQQRDERSRRINLLIVLMLSYSIPCAIINVASNYMEHILVEKGLSESNIFIGSCLNLLVGIPFPILFGYWMDRSSKLFEIGALILIVQMVGLIIFFYATQEVLLNIALLVTGITGSSITSIFLTLLSRTDDIGADSSDEEEKSGQNSSNVLLSLATVLSVVFLLVPFDPHVYSVLSVLICLVYVLYLLRYIKQ